MEKQLILKGIYKLVISLEAKTRFISIGAQRCGTTSLYFYLREHPDIYVSPIKETNFFSLLADNIPEHMWTHPLLKPQPRTIEEYELLFANATTQHAVGEVTPLYLYHPLTAGKIHEYIPDVKIIVCLRNPVERAYSAFQFERNWKRESEGNFRRAVEKQQQILSRTTSWWEFHLQSGVSTPYLDGSRYYNQVKRYFDLFPGEQIYLYLFEDFKSNTQQVMQEIFRFLHVDLMAFEVDNIHNDRQTPNRNQVYTALGAIKAFAPSLRNAVPKPIRRFALESLIQFAERKDANKLSVQDREWLMEQLHDDVIKLSKLTQLNLDHWLK